MAPRFVTALSLAQLTHHPISCINQRHLAICGGRPIMARFARLRVRLPTAAAEQPELGGLVPEWGGLVNAFVGAFLESAVPNIHTQDEHEARATSSGIAVLGVFKSIHWEMIW